MAKSKADEYRDKARECEELAQVARDPLVQQQILEIAEKWRTMAGRNYQTRGGPDSLRWFWSMNANGPMTRSVGRPPLALVGLWRPRQV